MKNARSKFFEATILFAVLFFAQSMYSQSSIKLVNSAGYDVVYTINWSGKNDNGSLTMGNWVSGTMHLGQSQTFSLYGVTSINYIKAKALNPFGKDKEVFNKSYSNINNVPSCFKVYGTIFDPKWNNKCD